MKTFFLFIFAFAITATADQAKPVLSYQYSIVEINTQTGGSQIFSEFEGKVKVGEKKAKYYKRNYIAANTQLLIKGTNPLSNFEIKDLFPLMIGGLNNGEFAPVYGQYHSHTTWWAPLFNLDAILMKDTDSDVYLRAITPKIQTWADFFAPGHASLNISPLRDAVVEVHYYRDDRGRAIEIPKEEVPPEITR
jgi:hypothetical protein